MESVAELTAQLDQLKATYSQLVKELDDLSGIAMEEVRVWLGDWMLNYAGKVVSSESAVTTKLSDEQLRQLKENIRNLPEAILQQLKMLLAERKWPAAAHLNPENNGYDAYTFHGMFKTELANALGPMGVLMMRLGYFQNYSAPSAWHQSLDKKKVPSGWYHDYERLQIPSLKVEQGFARLATARDTLSGQIKELDKRVRELESKNRWEQL